MKAFTTILAAVSLTGVALLFSAEHIVLAQPAKGARSAFERTRENMQNRFKDVRLTDDPDVNFTELMIASYEEMIFLAKTQLEYGADRQLRQSAQQISDEQQKAIEELKQWQVRRRQADYKAQPDQPAPGSGPLDQKRSPVRIIQSQSATPPASPSAQSPLASSATLPLVSATVEEVDLASGKLTMEHDAIPNLNMDGMTMPWRVQDPAMLRQIKKGDKIKFTADRVNGQPVVIKIQKR